jgi:hypothetical protein
MYPIGKRQWLFFFVSLVDSQLDWTRLRSRTIDMRIVNEMNMSLLFTRVLHWQHVSTRIISMEIDRSFDIDSCRLSFRFIHVRIHWWIRPHIERIIDVVMSTCSTIGEMFVFVRLRTMFIRIYLSDNVSYSWCARTLSSRAHEITLDQTEQNEQYLAGQTPINCNKR